QAKASVNAARLVLAPNAQIQVPLQPIWDDSVEAIVTVAVPDSCKNQRHLCRIEASPAVRLSTIPLMQWALRRDTLMVISSVPLQIRTARKHVAAAASPLALRIHYQHLDGHATPNGTAVVELAPPASMTQAQPSAAASAAASSPPAGASEVTSTQTGASIIGMMFVAIIGLFVVLITTRKWLDSRSQRQFNQKLKKIERKPVNIAPAYRPRPTVAAEDEVDAPPEKEEVPAPVVLEENNSPATTVSALTPSAPSVLSSASANENGATLEAILDQLQAVKADLQQIAAGQHEVKHCLAELTSGTKASAPEAFIRLALFDIIDETPAANRRDRAASVERPSRLRLRFAEESRKQGVAVDLALPVPLQINVAPSNGASKNFSMKLTAPSKLRILFAGNEENGETQEVEPQISTGDAEHFSSGRAPEGAVD
ncbi:MAG: hypothetical protein ONA90_09165, partial [candidate division KSB1 bacterium]|nr:hypothetical protein [candidate division KSB1 bacterium]